MYEARSTCVTMASRSVFAAYIGNVARAHLAAALYQSQHDRLGRNVAFAVLRFAADVSFVYLDNLVRAADWLAALQRKVFGQAFANAMHQKPSGLFAEAEQAGEL